jgi:hypothetical protein
MAKKKAPRARYNIGSKKVAGEAVETEAVIPASEQLKDSERYYIDGHKEMSDAELAVEIGKPVKLIEAYRFERSHQTPANRMLHRPAKGVVAMNESASMVSDDRTRELVSSTQVKKAIAEGDLPKAIKLQNEFNAQQAAQEKIQRDQYSDRIHYIKK